MMCFSRYVSAACRKKKEEVEPKLFSLCFGHWMLCSDTWIYKHSIHPTYQPIQIKDQAVEREEEEMAIPHFPMNGVHPRKGLANFAAPIAYLFRSSDDVYFVFREMYARHWVKLGAI